ncbi:MAG: transcriptional regulator NrdR [Dehalococcoidia bacterium]
MRCPFCNHRDSKVTDSRANDDGIRRRRECIACGQRFSTMEAVQLSELQVVKKDGRREPFNREKLAGGMWKACSKRNVALEEIHVACAEIEAKASAENRSEIPSAALGELAMEALRRIDHIAYIRFASVYRPFADLDSLKEAVRALEEGHAGGHDDRNRQLTLPVEEPAPRHRLEAVDLRPLAPIPHAGAAR